MAKLDSLIVDLQLNSAQLRAGLDEAKNKLEGFGKQLENINKKLGSLNAMEGFKLGKELITGLAEFVHKGLEAAEKMSAMAQGAGVTTKAFSQLNYAASLSGVSTEDLGTSFKKLNENLAEAGAGGSKQIALFKALGVSVKDSSGHVRDSGTVMTELAGKFSQYADGASKSSIATELFGKQGAALIPFLNEGKEGIEKLSGEADKFGISLSGTAAEGAKDFNDNMTRLHAIAAGVSVSLASQLAPALTNLTNQLFSGQEGADALKAATDGLASILKGLISTGIIVTTVFDVVGKTLGGAAAAILALVKGDFAGAKEGLQGLNADLAKTIQDGGKRWDAFWKDTGPIEEHAKVTKKSMDGMKLSINSGVEALNGYKEAMKSLTKVAEDYEAKVAGFGLGPLGELEAKLDKGDLSESLKKIGKDADDMKERILNAARALHELEMGKLSAKVDLDISKSQSATNQTVQQKTTDYNNIGKSIGDQNRTQGFESFDAAMKEYAKQTDINVRRIGEAELLKADGDEAGANRALEFADAAKHAADQASGAADAFKASKESLFAAVEGMVSKLTSKMGAVGDVVSSAVSGFKNGGIWGAIIGIIGEILSKLSGFGRMVDSMNNFFGTALKNIDNALGPLFDGIISACETIGQLIEMITSATYAFETIKVVMYVIGKVIDLVVLSIVGSIKAIMAIFGTHDEKIDKMVSKLEKDLQKGLDLSGFEQTDVNVKKLGDSAETTAKAVDKTADKFGELLTNLPSGYKTHGAQFGADNGGGGLTVPGAAPGQADEYHKNADGSGSVSQGQYSESTRPDSGVPTNTNGSAGSYYTGPDGKQYPMGSGPTSNTPPSGQEYYSSDDDRKNGTQVDESGQNSQGGDIVIQNVQLSASSLADFVKQLTEIQTRHTAVKRRNPFPSK